MLQGVEKTDILSLTTEMDSCVEIQNMVLPLFN